MAFKKPFEETWFYADLDEIGDSSPLDSDEAKHLTKALRLSDGDRVIASNGRGKVFIAQVQITDKVVSLTAQEWVHNFAIPPKLNLAISVLKGRDTEEPIEGVCQLNIHSIQLVITDHTQVFKGQNHDGLLERLRVKSMVALKQAKKAWLTEIKTPIGLKPWVEQNGNTPIILVHPGEDRLPESLVDGATLLTGPEGGFSAAEVEWLESRGCYRMGLGETRIRATHAPLLACGRLLVYPVRFAHSKTVS